MNSRHWRIGLLLMIWALSHGSPLTLAQEGADNDRVSSASLSNWRTAIQVFLTSQNNRLVERAERLLDDAIAGLPASEQREAYQYLDDRIRRGFARNAGGMRCLFSASERDKRKALFNKLRPAPWAQWNGPSLEALLQAYTESPERYSSEALLHEDFVAFCRQRSAHAPPDLVARILKGYRQGDFFNVLRFAHGVHADQANRWRAAFEAEYGDHASAATLWKGFGFLELDLWDSLSGVRNTYQQHLGDRLFARRPLSDWLALEPAQTLQLARASSHNLLEWQFKLTQALKSQRQTRGLSLLYYLCHTENNKKASYSKLAPLFAAEDQALFIYLHQPVRESQSVLDLLHTEKSNWDQSLDSLCAYLSVSRESSWMPALFPLLKEYYPRAGQRIDDAVITPIYETYAATEFPRSRKSNPIRAAILGEAILPGCFLRPATQHTLITWFQGHVDRSEVVCANQRQIPNYRFVAEGYLSVGERRLSATRDKKSASLKLVSDLASWGNWMLEGMMVQPDTLSLANNDVNAALSRVLGKVRDLKHEYELSREELALETLFAKLNEELSRAVAKLKQVDSTVRRGQAAMEHVVRSIHLSLVVSAILEDESQLQTVLSIIAEDLFALGERHSFRVLAQQDLAFTVETFLLLHDDLSKCLMEIVDSARGKRDSELRQMTRRFYLDYHRQIQLGLVHTSGFLGALEATDQGLKPFVRPLSGPSRNWLCFVDAEVSASFEGFKRALGNSDFLNCEQAIVNLLSAYRRRIGFCLWQDPSVCGLNSNANLMVLMRLLRSETPPAFSNLETRATTDSDWPRPALTEVIDHYIESLERGDSDLLLKNVTYAAPGPTPARGTVEHHALWLFAEFVERLLRAQEIASFPVMVQNVPVESQAHIDSLLRAALSDRAMELPPLEVSDNEQIRTRRLDGSRRQRLITALQQRPGDGSSLVRLAHFATLLPNDPCNAGDAGKLPGYDACRASVFEQMSQALDRWSDTESKTLADALIAGLRLEFSQRQRTPVIPGHALAERFHGRLSTVGRQRILMEILTQTEEVRSTVPVRIGCPAHQDAPEVSCRACRGSLSQALTGRVQGLADVRRFCSQNLDQQFEGPPRTKLEVIGQLTRSMQRLRDASSIIEQIDPDSVKAAYRLLKQLKRAYAVIPANWTPEQIKQEVDSPDDPLAVMLVGLERMGVAMYSEFLPFHGDFDTSAILSNPDALVVFSLFDAEMKQQLLQSMALTAAMEAQMPTLQAPIGTPETAELVLVHSIVQPSLATGIWEEGHQPVIHGQSLIEFVVMGKSYDESFFDRNLAYVVSSEFKLSPRKLFEESFQGIDIAAQAARQRVDTEWDGDAFIYEVWFGDLRAALREQGDRPREQFNLDRFVQRAATIPDDTRYHAEKFARIRPAAEKFQQELGAWLDSGGPAVLGRMLEGASSVQTLLALQEGICERLGLGQESQSLDPMVRQTYGDFCTKAIFERRHKRASYPQKVTDRLCHAFIRTEDGDTLSLQSRREQFRNIFQPFRLARWGSEGTHDDQAHQLAGYSALYRRMMELPASDQARHFLGDCSYALMTFASTLYWTGARDGVTETVDVADEQRISYPWRLDNQKRPYLVGSLPTNALTAERLHNEAIQANAEWRASCAHQYRGIPFLYRFFGGTPASQDNEGGN